jgi:hypothetical protein
MQVCTDRGQYGITMNVHCSVTILSRMGMVWLSAQARILGEFRNVMISISARARELCNAFRAHCGIFIICIQLTQTQGTAITTRS